MADLRATARAKARKYGLDEHIFERQINAESGFNPNSGSSAGAQGIAQIMPATAKAWGVNPHDSVAALDAAAKHMAAYVAKYHSYDKALRAYNAGEGAIERSHNFGETNAYVAKILSNGRDPGKLGKSSGNGKAVGSSTQTKATTIKAPGTTTVEPTETSSFDQAGYDRQVKLAQLKGVLSGFKDHRSSILQSVLPDAADPAAFTKSVIGTKTTTTPGKTITLGGSTSSATQSRKPASSAAAAGGKIPGLGGKGSGLLELIYNNGGKGYGVKDKKIVNGSQVFAGVWAGHANHVHVAAGKKTIVGLGKLAQSMGLHVGENSHFGGENPGAHVAGSYHNRDMAIDVSAPMTAAGKAKMEAYAKRVRQIYFGK